MLKIRPNRGLGKNELLRELMAAKSIGGIHLRLSKILAVELYRLAPKHEIFTDGTFSPASLTSIEADAKQFPKYTELRAAR